jgi:hypothetical protein
VAGFGGHTVTSKPARSASNRVAVAIGVLLTLAITGGCSRLRPYQTPAEVDLWQDPSPPRLSITEKAHIYQQRLENWHQMPDGMIRYRFNRRLQTREDRGNHADGPYFLGIYLASQALRYAATGDSGAREQILLTLQGARLYAELSGRRGLLARYFSPTTVDDPRWRPSPTHPGYHWRSDVSKDQYAGFVHGLGVTWAVVPDPDIRAAIRPLATAIADHLIDNELRILDWDGEQTKYGDLRGRRLGIPFGVDALIALAIAKTAAEATHETRYEEFYDGLVAAGYPGFAYWSHLSFGLGKRVNDTMAFLALYPLLLLETDQRTLDELRRAVRRTWRHVRGEENAFLAFVTAAAVASTPEDFELRDSAALEGQQALALFPDRKLGYPVDLTRAGFDFPQRLLKTSDGLPRSRDVVVLYLRPRESSMWAGSPYRLVGRLAHRGETEYSGIDYLSAYWIGRYHGFVEATAVLSNSERLPDR